jgi:molybdopterin-binding protein
MGLGRGAAVSAVSLDRLIARYASIMSQSYRVREAAELLGMSDDTLRRWIDAGRIEATTGPNNRIAIEGVELARVAQKIADDTERLDVGLVGGASARNRMIGIVTRVVRDKVMAQVEMQAGPYRIVSLMSREAADELELEPGSLAIASIKATNVVIELPATAG